MIEKLEDVWASRDYPVLREVARRIDAGALHVEDHQVAEATALPIETVRIAGRALARRRFLKVDEGYDGDIAFHELSGSAYLITGLHPNADDALSDLISLIRQASDQAADEDEKSRLRRAADALSSVTRDVMVGVMTAYATKYGMP